MSRRVEIPTQEFVWTLLLRRIEEHFRARKSKILELCGLYHVFGHPGPGFTGEQEGEQFIKELTGVLVTAYGYDLQDRCDRARSKQEAGRPCEVLSPEAGPKLLDLFSRYHPSAGRISAWTSVDGNLVQEETGPLFRFFEAALEPLNEHLEELGWKPVSAARAARFALAERKRRLDTGSRREKRKSSAGPFPARC